MQRTWGYPHAELETPQKSLLSIAFCDQRVHPSAIIHCPMIFPSYHFISPCLLAKNLHQFQHHKPAMVFSPSVFPMAFLYWLVVWLPFFIFPYIGLLIIPIDFHIFQKGLKPPTRSAGGLFRFTNKNQEILTIG